MPSYKAPVEDVLFLLNDVFGIERYNNLPGFADATPDIVEAILAEGAKLCEEVLAPLNRIGDQEGCTPPRRTARSRRRRASRPPTTPMREGGWMGLSAAARVWRPGPAVRRSTPSCRSSSRRPTWRSACIRA